MTGTERALVEARKDVGAAFGSSVAWIAPEVRALCNIKGCEEPPMFVVQLRTMRVGVCALHGAATYLEQEARNG